MIVGDLPHGTEGLGSVRCADWISRLRPFSILDWLAAYNGLTAVLLNFLVAATPLVCVLRAMTQTSRPALR